MQLKKPTLALLNEMKAQEAGRIGESYLDQDQVHKIPVQSLLGREVRRPGNRCSLEKNRKKGGIKMTCHNPDGYW